MTIDQLHPGLSRPEMILFDYGGTLMYEPEWDHVRGTKALFEHVILNPHGYTPEEVSNWETAFYQSMLPSREAGAELTEIQMLRLTYERHGIVLDIPYEEAEFILWDATSPMGPGNVCPHVESMLSALDAMGIRTGVISNIGWTGRALRRRIAAQLPGHRFEFIMTSSDYGIRKPGLPLFETALEKAGLTPGKIWHCGDTAEKDAAGAHGAGIFPVLYRGTLPGAPERTPGEVLPDFPLLTIHDWRQLTEILRYINDGKM